MPAFSKKEALSFGWKTFWGRWKFFIGLLLLILLLNYLPGTILQWVTEQYTVPIALSIALSMVLWLLGMLVSLGQARIILNAVEGKSLGYGQIFGERKLIIGYVFGMLAASIVTIAGFLLFILPGIIVIVRIQYWMYVMLDEGLGPIAAIRKSWAITKGSTMNLMLFSALLLLVATLGVLALGVGLVVAYPVILLANVWVYRTLLQVRPDLNGE